MSTLREIDLVTIEGELVTSNNAFGMESFGLDMLSTAFESLDTIATSLENLVDRETPMSPACASAYQVAIQSVSGGALPHDLISLEAYEGDDLAQTTFSLEALKETLIKLWEKLKLTIKRAMQAVSDFIAKLFGGVKKMGDLVTRMTLRAKKLNGVNGEGTVSVDNIDRLMLGNTVNERVIERGLKVISREFYTATEEYAGIVGLYQKQVDQLLSGSGPILTSDMEAFAESELVLTRETMGLFRKYESTQELPGGRALKFKTTGSWFDSKQVIKGIDIVDHPNVKNPPNRIEIKTPSANWVVDRLEDIASVVNTIQKDERLKKVQAFVDRQVDLNKAMTERVKSAGQFEKELTKSNKDTTKAAMSSMRRDYILTVTRLDTYTFRYLRAVLSHLSTVLDKLESTSEKDV